MTAKKKTAAKECCGSCGRWDRLTDANQIQGQPARGICCGEPPVVIHVPTEAAPHQTISAERLTQECRLPCHLYVARKGG